MRQQAWLALWGTPGGTTQRRRGRGGRQECIRAVCVRGLTRWHWRCPRLWCGSRDAISRSARSGTHQRIVRSAMSIHLPAAAIGLQSCARPVSTSNLSVRDGPSITNSWGLCVCLHRLSCRSLQSQAITQEKDLATASNGRLVANSRPVRSPARVGAQVVPTSAIAVNSQRKDPATTSNGRRLTEIGEADGLGV